MIRILLTAAAISLAWCSTAAAAPLAGALAGAFTSIGFSATTAGILANVVLTAVKIPADENIYIAPARS